MAIGIFTLALIGCSDDVPDRTPSPETDPDCAQIYFPDTNPQSLELELDVTSIEIFVSRLNSSSAVVVPISVLSNESDIFVIPETVSFGAGEAETSFVVTFPNAQLAVAYSFEIIIQGEEYIDHYTKVDGAASLFIQMERIKWEKYADGTYTSNYFESSWPVTLYKAYGTNKYRFYNLWENGYNWDFTWEGGASIIPGGTQNSSGYYVSVTGSVDPEYGMVSVQTDGDPEYSFYDAETNTFKFDRKWVVDLGSFGWFSETYEITSLYE